MKFPPRNFNLQSAGVIGCFGCFLFVGCVENPGPGKAANTKVMPDDKAAVAALEKAGCSLKQDAAGLVT